jgi:16S rRNA C967 or C1407 C5-methylase (RsmB/RsmF family)
VQCTLVSEAATTVVGNVSDTGMTEMYDVYKKAVRAAPPMEFFVDEHIEGLLVFPPRTNLSFHPLVSCFRLILQGKGSCIPAQVLNPERGSHVIDTCAAPGNKTLHLASIMRNSGRVCCCATVATAVSVAVLPADHVVQIFAFDKDEKRNNLLARRVAGAKATNILAATTAATTCATVATLATLVLTLLNSCGGGCTY